MKTTRSLAAIMILASSVAVACVGEPNDTESNPDAAEAPAEAEQALDTPSPDATSARPDDHRGRRGEMGHQAKGPLGPFMMGLRDLDLSDAQRAELATLKSSMRPEGEREQAGALNESLARAIESGSVDVADFDAELDQIEARAAARVAATQQALNTLHATLTPAQRTQLVTTMKEKMAAHGERAEGKRGQRAGKRGVGADGEKRALRREADGARQQRGGEAGRGKGKRGHMLGMLTRALDLSDAQRTQIEGLASNHEERPDKTAEHEQRRAQHEAVMAAFESDSFDAAALGVGSEMTTMARAKTEKMIEGLAQVVPILDANQRTELAKLVQEKGMGAKGKRGARGKLGQRGQRGQRGADGQRVDRPELAAPERR